MVGSLKYYAIVELSRAFLCKKDVLGTVFPFKIADFEFRVLLPRLPLKIKHNEDQPFSEIDQHLRPPIFADKWKRGDDAIYWGRPVITPIYNCEISNFLFEVSTNKPLSEESIKRIYFLLLEWRKQFEIFTRLTHLQHITPNFAPYENHRIELLSSDVGGLKHIDTGKFNIPVIYVNLNLDRTDFISRKDLRKVLRNLSEPNTIKFEYLPLDAAYSAYIENDLRKAVLEASCGIEVSVSNMINSSPLIKKIKSKEKILNKFRTLANLFELAAALDINVIEKKRAEVIVNIRNKVLHAGIAPTEDEAKNFLEDARNILFRMSNSLK